MQLSKENIREKEFHNNLQSQKKGRFEDIFYKALFNANEDFFEHLKKSCQDKLILDYGCGIGNTAEKVSKYNAKSITGIDISEVSISKAKAFVHAGIEDFGIAPVEAQSCGTPVIAYNLGGLSETVIDGKTGILFNFQTTDAILDALKRFKKTKFNLRKISEHAEQFSEERFAQNFQNFIDLKIKQ